MADQEQKQPEEGIEAEQNEPQAGAADNPESVEDAATGGEELSPEQLIEQLQEEVAAAKDASLRAIAEGQNAQRRAEQDVEKARKFALESFAKELLPVVDNLERAL